MQHRSLPLPLFALCLIASPAYAHVGLGHTESFATGFWHPLGGLDHVLAMSAVGLYAASLAGSAIWLVPSAFVGTMVVGGALGYAGLPLPYVQQGIGLSVIAVAAAIAFGMKLPTTVAMGFVGLFAFFHGHAHGIEGAGLASFLPFAAGFVLATSLVHLAGIALGFGFDRIGSVLSVFLRRSAGAVSAIAGISILAGWLAA